MPSMRHTRSAFESGSQHSIRRIAPYRRQPKATFIRFLVVMLLPGCLSSTFYGRCSLVGGLLCSHCWVPLYASASLHSPNLQKLIQEYFSASQSTFSIPLANM